MYRQLIKFDKWCNYQLRHLLNRFLKRKEGYEFGDKRETISSALGKNMMDKTLTNFGWFICSLIEVVDTFIWILKFKPRYYRDHCISAIHDLDKDPTLAPLLREAPSYEARVEGNGEISAIVKADPPKDPPNGGDSGLPHPPKD